MLNLNGTGKATDIPGWPPLMGRSRFALGQATVPVTTLHNPVVLQSDSEISVVANGS